MRIRSFTRFWAIIGVAVLLVAVIYGAWAYSLNRTEIEVFENYNQQQLRLIQGTAVGIEGLFSDLASDLFRLGQLPEIQYFDEVAARSALSSKLGELEPQGIGELGVLDAAGVARFFASHPEVEGVDYSWRGYFKDAQSLTSPVEDGWLIVEEAALGLGQTGFLVAVPFYETAIDAAHPFPDGRFAGVILGTLTFNNLVERHIAPFKPPGDGQIYLVDQELDVVWSSDAGLLGANLLGGSQRAYTGLVSAISSWQTADPQAAAYSFETPGGRAEVQLIAFAPVHIGGTVMVVGVRIPGSVARQTSYANFQGQQLVLIASVTTLLLGVLVGGLLLNIETRRRFRLEEALRKSEKDQAVLAERNRLAGDLHDSVTQGLYGIVLHADAARAQLAAGRQQVALNYLEEIRTAGQEGLAEMRMLIFELRPPMLVEEGLVAALENRLYAVERRVGLKASIQADLPDRLPADVEDALYGIAREALNNILKHAGAGQVRLDLRIVDGRVRMEISDDGCGFELPAALQGGGMGLANMRSRAEKVGGQATVRTRSGEGTHISVEVKL